MHVLAIMAVLAVAAGEPDGKTMATDSWHGMDIYGVAADGTGPMYLQVHAGDLDGDGRPDDAVVKLVCAGGALSSAHYNVVSPRDAATGQASGKRMHRPVTFIKEWGPATPQLAAMKPTYDVKKVEGTGARMGADSQGWTPIALAGADGLCDAAATAVKATKTRSNIQNN